MKRVTGIGGIFFKAKDAPALQAWYKRHLGIDVQEWGGTAFTWTDGGGKPLREQPSGPLVRRKVTSLRPALQLSWSTTGWTISTPWSKSCADEGCNVLEKIDDSEYGKFAWVIDPEGKQGRTVATACRPMKMTLHAIREEAPSP